MPVSPRTKSVRFDNVQNVSQDRLRHQRHQPKLCESCLKVRRVDCVINAPVPQGRLRHQRECSAGSFASPTPPFRRVDCVINETWPRNRGVGPPSCDPAPLTTSLRGLWVSGNAGTGQWWNVRRGGDQKTDRATQRGGDPKTDQQKEELSKQLGCEGRRPENPGVVAPLIFCKLSRQLLALR